MLPAEGQLLAGMIRQPNRVRRILPHGSGIPATSRATRPPRYHPPMRILLVEDDAVLRDVMLRKLRESGHRVDEAATDEDAEHLWRVQAFDVVLLDLNLPLNKRPQSGLASGLSVLRGARARGDRTPVLVLTARNRTEERIAGLNAGADDYIGKPFDLAEVEARLRAIVRRTMGTHDKVQVGGLALDRQNRRFSVHGQSLELPAREFEVLWELMTPAGRVVSKREMAEKLSDLEDYLGDNALEAFISRLRKKLVGSGVQIRTLRGLGYLLEAEP
jgi:DNA-binding response OmpR family regulator